MVFWFGHFFELVSCGTQGTTVYCGGVPKDVTVDDLENVRLFSLTQFFLLNFLHWCGWAPVRVFELGFPLNHSFFCLHSFGFAAFWPARESEQNRFEEWIRIRHHGGEEGR